MIKELLTDLVNTIAAIPEFENRVGVTVGGTSQDPELLKVPLPFAWVIYTGNTNVEPAQGGSYQEVLYGFTVVVGIGYGAGQTDFLDNQIALLEKVPAALLGQTPYKYADQWNYEGSFLDEPKANRLIYKLNFSVVGHHVPGQTP